MSSSAKTHQVQVSNQEHCTGINDEFCKSRRVNVRCPGSLGDTDKFGKTKSLYDIMDQLLFASTLQEGLSAQNLRTI